MLEFSQEVKDFILIVSLLILIFVVVFQSWRDWKYNQEEKKKYNQKEKKGRQ